MAPARTTTNRQAEVAKGYEGDSTRVRTDQTGIGMEVTGEGEVTEDLGDRNRVGTVSSPGVDQSKTARS